MKVTEPTSYGIEFTNEEEKILTDCTELLNQIGNIAIEKKCDYICDENTEIGVDIRTLTQIRDKLLDLLMADTMY